MASDFLKKSVINLFNSFSSSTISNFINPKVDTKSVFFSEFGKKVLFLIQKANNLFVYFGITNRVIFVQITTVHRIKLHILI